MYGLSSTNFNGVSMDQGGGNFEPVALDLSLPGTDQQPEAVTQPEATPEKIAAAVQAGELIRTTDQAADMDIISDDQKTALKNVFPYLAGFILILFFFTGR